MSLPTRTSRGKEIIGLSASELIHRPNIKDTELASALSERSFLSLQQPSTLPLLALPVDTSDATLIAIGNALPVADFARVPSTVPHLTAVSLRQAGILLCIANAKLSEPNAKFITLVGPSFAQFKQVQQAFPLAEVVVFQPVTDSRDAQRWRGHLDSIHDSLWTASSAVRADIVFSFFSVGDVHAASFAEGLIAAQASFAYVMHLLSAGSLVHETRDVFSSARFTPRGPLIDVSYGDSPSYLDSVEAVKSWLSGDFRANDHGFFMDVLAQVDSFHVLKVASHAGPTAAPGTSFVDFRDQFMVLPPVPGHAQEVIPVKLWDPVVDYASRSSEFTITLQTIRGRIASMKHKVSVGSTVIQDAVFCSDATADHLAVVCLEFVKLRAAINAENDMRTERAIAAAALPTAALTSLNEKTGGLLTVAEVAARASINLSTKPARTMYNAFVLFASVGDVSRCIGRPVNYTPAIPSGSDLTLLEKVHNRIDSRQDRLKVLECSLRQFVRLGPVHVSELVKGKLFLNQVVAPVLRRVAYNFAVISSSALPAPIRFAIVKLLHQLLNSPIGLPKIFGFLRWVTSELMHAIPLGETFFDRLYALVAEYLGYDFTFDFGNPHVSRPNFRPPSERSGSSSSSSSSSPSTSGEDEDEDELRALSTIAEEEEQEELVVLAPQEEAAAPPPHADQPILVAPPETIVAAAAEALYPEVAEVVPVATGSTADRTHELEFDNGAVETHPLPPPPSALAPEISALILPGTVNLNLPLNRRMDTNPLDSANPIPAFDQDMIFGAQRNVPDLGTVAHKKVVVCGPNSLKRSIVHGLTSSGNHFVSKACIGYLSRNAHSIRSVKQGKKNNGKAKNMKADLLEAEARLGQVPPTIKLIDVVVEGLPAAGKSTALRTLIHKEDLIVVPTTTLARKWRADLKAWKIDALVCTQIVALTHAKNSFRVVWIDEGPLLEAIHLIHLAALGTRSVALGDFSQIKAFHVRKTQSQYPLNRSCARTWIRAPYSLGLPVDVLALGIRLGFAPQDALTFNQNEALEYLDDELDFPPASADHLNIVFNQDRVTESVSITAHAAQGSRPKTAYVKVHATESAFAPLSAHFWVAISRATERTQIFLCRESSNALLEVINSSVQGLFRIRANPVSLVVASVGLLGFIAKLEKASCAQAVGQLGWTTTRPEFMVDDVATFEEPPVALNPFARTMPEINDALMSVNFNVEGTDYNDFVAEGNPSSDKPLTQPLQVSLDLQASQKHATCTLQKAGVYFASDDSKTEFFTIATRYLSQVKLETPDPEELAVQMLNSFELAYLKKDMSITAYERSAHFTSWVESRQQGTFQPSDYAFGENSATTTFHSFLKAHAKAKNDPGFGASPKFEKGQTIAAGDQSYNVRHTAFCREIQSFLTQASLDNVFFDVGFSDSEYEAHCTDHLAYSPENTQIDLSSQDSTHYEPHVLMFTMLLLKYTSITEAEALEYLTMRSKFTVRAKSFSCDQSIKYSVSWNLPSGDPYTLIANIVHESSSIGYAFFEQLRKHVVIQKKALNFKGDDTYAAFRLSLGLLATVRIATLGVILKIDHNLPPFFANRYILPDNTVHSDLVKIAAKYSGKKHDPSKVAEYVISYRSLCPDLSIKHYELLVAYGLLHHRSMNEQQIRVLMDFALSLKCYAAFLRFQDFAGLSEQFVDPPTDCIRSTFGSLHYPKPARDIPCGQLVRFCTDHELPFHFKPSFTHTQLRMFARANPNLPVFNTQHCLAFLSSTRYSDVSQY
nr:polyprotein [Heterobasidion alpha-like virus 1]